MRLVLGICSVLTLLSCGSSPKGDSAVAKAPAKVRITQFYASESKVPRGLKGSLCYGVENAKTVELDPPVEQVWPALTRCIEIAPSKKTTYTLTAHGEDGSVDKKTAEVGTAAPPPRLYDLWVNKVDVKRGEQVQLCFKVENTVSVNVSAGKLDRSKNCLFDKPAKTTTYKITAIGGDKEIDSGTVTVKVH